ncbi:MAG: glycosyltransferase [Balneolaceae bacterium]
MNKKDKSLVSVIIPTHNRSDLLKRAVNSVLEQTWRKFEIVIVDDASDDDTQQVLQELSKAHPVNVIRNKTSKGASVSRNIAISNAKGEFIAGLDDDDFWRPERIERLMEGFDEGISAVCSNDRMVFGEKEIVWKKKPLITLDDLLYYNQVGNQVLTRKEYLLDVGGYDESLPSAQDYDLWIRLVKQFGPVKTVPHTLQVIHMENTRDRISNSEDQIEGYYQCFEKHRHLMDQSHIRYQLYRLRMVKGETVSWIDLFRSVPPKLYIKEITRKLFL